MGTYILATKLSTDVTQQMSRRKELGRAWLNKVEEACPDVKWLHHFAVLGPYDFIDIYAAPDTESAARVAIVTLSHGAASAETWAALDYPRFLKLVEEVEG